MVSNRQNVIRPLRRAAVASAVLALVAAPAFASPSSGSVKAKAAVSSRHYSKFSWLKSGSRPRPVRWPTSAPTTPAPTTTSPKPTVTVTTTTSAPTPTTTSARPTTTTAAPTTNAPTTTTAAPTTNAPTTTTPANTVPPVSYPGTFSFGAGEPLGASYFGPNNFWHTTLTGAPTDSNSANMVANLANQAASLYGGIAAFNAYRYNVSFYTVDSSVPRRDVIWDNCQSKNYTPPGLLGAGGEFAAVPIPDNAIPSPGDDSSLTVYSPSLDTAWEFWKAHKQSDGWHACWGGRMQNMSTRSEGYFFNGFGSTATGMAGFAGVVTVADVKAGRIDHVLSLAIPSPARWDNISWPAQRSDGGDVGPNVIPEGTRFRLDPSINVDALNLSPIAKMVAKAAQTYGFIVTDKAGCVSVIAESGDGIKAATGSNPWDTLLGGTPDYLTMRNFPWGSLQAMPRNYGKP